jgi:hypothetical protein
MDTVDSQYPMQEHCFEATNLTTLKSIEGNDSFLSTLDQDDRMHIARQICIGGPANVYIWHAHCMRKNDLYHWLFPRACPKCLRYHLGYCVPW